MLRSVECLDQRHALAILWDVRVSEARQEKWEAVTWGICVEQALFSVLHSLTVFGSRPHTH